jgi:hypothetical protein
MSTIRNFKAARNNPTPDERSSWNFRLWSYGNMRPLHCITLSGIVANAPRIFLQVFIPKNTWAGFKHLFVWADVAYQQNGGPHPGGRQLVELNNLQSIGMAVRNGPTPIANSIVTTRYVIQRQYQWELGGLVYEENTNIQGNTTMAGAANTDHRFVPYLPTTAFDNTQDAYLEFAVANTFAGSTDTISCHTAQAFIQAPLNLNRFPQ